MKVVYTLNDQKKNVGLEKESYEVLAYGNFNENLKIFLIVNDYLDIVNIDPSVLEVIDDDLSEYVQKNELNYGKDFFVHKNLIQYISDFDSYHRLTFNNNLWEQSKISNFFIENNYLIPEKYKNTVLNTNYKINLIAGYLMFANLYINIKYEESSYMEELFFYVTESFDEIVNKPNKKVEQIEVTDYKSRFQNFIKTNLYDENENEIKSIGMCENLFRLIDSIFINPIDSVYLIESYEEVFVIGYENKYYCLDKYSGS